MHTSRVMIVAVVIGLSVGGCKGKKNEGGAGTGTGTGTSTGTAAGTDAEVLPAAVAVDEAAVKKVIDAWLAAQNGGDFAGYQALYADKMEGVKRVGARMWRFDRKGWLADRQRMFKHTMKVGARDVAIRGSATAPSVELVQTFQQGKFSDEGPKRLVLVKSPTGFQIAREEMISSVVAGAPVAPGPGSIFLVFEVDGRQQVVIQEGADAAWGKGRLHGPFDGAHQYATRDASAAPAAATWAGRALAVHAADGTRCDAKVGALRLVGGGSPHFGEMQSWNDEHGMGDGHVWSQAERARSIFGMSEPYLVGELAITGDCKPLFATDPAATPKIFAAAASPDATLAAAAVTAFRALPGYKDLQTDFVDNFAGSGQWIPDPSVEAFGNYFVVSGNEGNGCGDFLGQLIAIFENRNGKMVLVSDPNDGFVNIAAVIDSNGDNLIELIGAVGDYQMVIGHLTTDGSGNFRPVAQVTFPFNDCGC